MSLTEFIQTYLPQIERSLKSALRSQAFGESQELKEMLAYHMGWQDGATHGKRLRPLVTLLCMQALGGQMQTAMPAALAVEFLHNFTLIHDDIEDRSPTRHGRETLWMRWGDAQAINAGDALFSIAQLAMLDLAQSAGAEIAVRAARRFNQTCLSLTQGQYLDIAFEKEEDISTETYLEMIQGKTGALIGFAAGLGGVITKKNKKTIQLLEKFGESLGIAFQIQDDFLGIWGDPEITGKSIASDLLSRKKTLPVLYGLENCAEFRKIWSQNEINTNQVAHLSTLLRSCGAQEFIIDKAEKYTADAFKALKVLFPSQTIENKPAEALFELSGDLLNREF
jgi:geranylgeranyl diphosphate synthase, type I